MGFPKDNKGTSKIHENEQFTQDLKVFEEDLRVLYRISRVESMKICIYMGIDGSDEDLSQKSFN